MTISHVGEVDPDPVAHGLDTPKRRSVGRQHRIDEHDLGTELHQPQRKIAADEADSTGDQDAFARVELTHDGLPLP